MRKIHLLFLSILCASSVGCNFKAIKWGGSHGPEVGSSYYCIIVPEPQVICVPVEDVEKLEKQDRQKRMQAL